MGIEQTQKQTLITPSGGVRVTLVRNHIHSLIIGMDKSGSPLISVDDSPMVQGPDIVI